MSMLIEKRNELVAKLEALEVARKTDINDKVEAYRAALEAQIPKDEIERVKTVISALDEVIAYDTTDASAKVDVQVAAQPRPSLESRPGMTSVFTPSRN